MDVTNTVYSIVHNEKNEKKLLISLKRREIDYYMEWMRSLVRESILRDGMRTMTSLTTPFILRMCLNVIFVFV